MPWGLDVADATLASRCCQLSDRREAFLQVAPSISRAGITDLTSAA